jgi:hypothetical protein
LIKRRIEALTPSKFIALSPRLPSHLRRAPGPSDGHGASDNAEVSADDGDFGAGKQTAPESSR